MWGPRVNMLPKAPIFTVVCPRCDNESETSVEETLLCGPCFLDGENVELVRKEED